MNTGRRTISKRRLIAVVTFLLVATMVAAIMAQVSRLPWGTAGRRIQVQQELISAGEELSPRLSSSSAGGQESLRVPVQERVVLSVRSKNGRPIRDATVLLLGSQSGGTTGSSDDAGAVVFEIPRGQSAKVRIDSEGFDGITQLLSMPLASSYNFVLAPNARICGTVVGWEGNPVGPELEVVAAESSASLTLQSLIGSKEDERLIHRARTDFGGRFCIEGLDRSKQYTIVCGGQGFAMRLAKTGVRPDEANVVLEVQRLFAIQVRFVDQSGRDARVGDVNRHRINWWSDAENVTVTTTGLAPFLAGVPVTGGAAQDNSLTLLFLDSSTSDHVLPIHIAGSIAGYDEFRLALNAYPVDGGIQEALVRLVPSARGWGSVRVNFDAQPVGSAVDVEQWLPTCVLTLMGDAGQVLKFRLDSPTLASVVLMDVPYGDYEATLRGIGSSFKYPRTGYIDLRCNESSPIPEITVPLGGLGAVELKIVDSSGGDYQGRVQIVVSEGWQSESVDSSPYVSALGGTIQIGAAPYNLRGLEEGRYTVTFLFPRSESSDLLQVPVEVKAGVCGRYSLSLPPQ